MEYNYKLQTCTRCGMIWNTGHTVPVTGNYICPHCTKQMERGKGGEKGHAVCGRNDSGE